MAIVPDDKNWTWVLERACNECGFDSGRFEVDTTASAIIANAAQWANILAHQHVRVRPTENQWSALEYGCHVRDVFRLFERRLKLMLDFDSPSFENWDQDRTAIDDEYGNQDPAVVSRELVEAGEALARRFATVAGDQWLRTGLRSDGAEFSVHTFAQYLMHDPVHHVHDAQMGYQQLAQ